MAGVGLAGTWNANNSATWKRAMVGLAGDVNPNGQAYRGTLVGIAGLNSSGAGFVRRSGMDKALVPPAAGTHLRVGDDMAERGIAPVAFFVDFPNATRQQGRDVVWQNGRESLFGRAERSRDVFLDSAGFSRVISGNAPKWAHQQSAYHAAVDLVDPDHYVAFDFPGASADAKRKTFDYLDETVRVFPADGSPSARRKLWPVWSPRWTWDDQAVAQFNRLPKFAAVPLADYVPQTPNGRVFKPEQTESWARAAIANAIITSADPDFKRLCSQFGRVAIGGLVHGPIRRNVRHLYAAVLAELIPEVQFWLLGQASNVVINGLSRLDLLDRVGADGTWYLHQARCEELPFLDSAGMIGTLKVGQGLATNGVPLVQSLFSLSELMVANIRALTACYMGLVNWPTPLKLPVDARDAAALLALRDTYRVAGEQLALF